MKVIPQTELDSYASRGWQMRVHVEGWNPACVFNYCRTENGKHLITSRGKRWWVTNNLLYTRKDEPND